MRVGRISTNSADRSVTLVVPALREAAPDTADVPTTATLLARARVREVPRARGLEGALLHLFGAVTDPGELPVAALTRLADTRRADSGWWLQADPVHLAPDRDRLVLFGPCCLELERPEADALVTALRAHFADRYWTWEAPAPARWRLRLEGPPALAFTPLPAVIGHDIRDRLPQGADARKWHAILNEIQMLLSAHPVNAQRERAGRPGVNSVWLWGGGRLPRVDTGRWNGVWGDEPLARGLARLAGCAWAMVPASAEKWLDQRGPGTHLVVLDRLQRARASMDPDAWLAAVGDLERSWIGPLLRALRRGRVQRLALLPGDGRVYELTRAHLLRFWRRRRPLASGGPA